MLLLANHLRARRFPSAAGTVGAPTAVINGHTIALPPQAIATGAKNGFLEPLYIKFIM
eukprot:COSAG06_NODE_671_length_13206_cov_477.269474_11_plen_58_part_00